MSASPATAGVEFMAKWSNMYPRTVFPCHQLDEWDNIVYCRAHFGINAFVFGTLGILCISQQRNQLKEMSTTRIAITRKTTTGKESDILRLVYYTEFPSDSINACVIPTDFLQAISQEQSKNCAAVIWGTIYICNKVLIVVLFLNSRSDMHARPIYLRKWQMHPEAVALRQRRRLVSF